MAEICVYMTSVSSRLQISKQQRAILDFLDARGIEYTPIDMCANTKARGQMLEKLPEDSEGKKNFLPPQVFNGDEHCGDYESFFDAREADLIFSFFKLNTPEGSSEAKLLAQFKAQGITPPYAPKNWWKASLQKFKIRKKVKKSEKIQ